MTNDNGELKACPCGKVPTKLNFADANQGRKWAYVMGNCCGEWMTEFRTNYLPLESPELYEIGVKAWNESPRPDSRDGSDLAELRQFYSRTGMEALMAKYWPDVCITALSQAGGSGDVTITSDVIPECGTCGIKIKNNGFIYAGENLLGCSHCYGLSEPAKPKAEDGEAKIQKVISVLVPHIPIDHLDETGISVAEIAADIIKALGGGNE